MGHCSIPVFTRIVAVLESENGQKRGSQGQIDRMISLCGELEELHRGLPDLESD